MSQDLPAQAYALLGLLSYGDAPTGYELKQRADVTLRFYWQAPAMSQVYSELHRLERHDLVRPEGSGRGRRWHLTEEGDAELRRWMRETPAGFPVWKHPVALRLMIGHLTDDTELVAMLEAYDAELVAAREDLQAVLDMLSAGDSPVAAARNPALVAEWGVAHFEHEREVVARLAEVLRRRSEGTP